MADHVQRAIKPDCLAIDLELELPVSKPSSAAEYFNGQVEQIYG